LRLGLILTLGFVIGGTAVLIGLGTWQLRRMEWKQGIISDLEARIGAPPVALPADPDPERDAYLHVTMEAKVGGPELDVLTSLRPYGPGFDVIVPVELPDGRRIMADLGYVPEATKHDPRPAREGTITGALYWPHEVNYFTPPPDLKENIWFARDLGPMAKALGTDPVMLVAESHPLGRWPEALPLGVNVSNDHLDYAITWFSLALIWSVMGTMLIARERRRRPA
jgi:surfeit locus 1 family protein